MLSNCRCHKFPVSPVYVSEVSPNGHVAAIQFAVLTLEQITLQYDATHFITHSTCEQLDY